MSESNTSDEIRRYLQFSLGAEDFALPLLSVKEVIAIPEITPIPQTPSHFLGIMNLRGQVISVIDLRVKFGIKHEKSEDNAVIICDLNPLCLGVVVDSVNSVLSLTSKDVNDKPEIDSKQRTDYISGVTRVGKKLVLLLELAKALNLEEQAALKRAGAKG